MDKRLKVRYDKIGDILYLDICTPYVEQETEELDDEIIARMNPISGEIENLEILFFSRRAEQVNLWELPITASFQLVS
jgi:uncharacterized protein YuzE